MKWALTWRGCWQAIALSTALCVKPAPAQIQALASLAWLTGCWAGESAEAGTGEHWMPLAGGTMLGVGRTVKGGRTVAHEFMQIRTDGQGQLVFVALPSGRQETTFVLKTAVEHSVVFENLEHPFPQRVIYQQRGPDRLEARIEGLRAGEPRGIDFPMRRVDCTPPR